MLASTAACSSDDAEVNVVGTWRPTSAPGLGLHPEYPLGKAILTFSADGTWTGYNGCNDSDEGEYRIEGDELYIRGQTIDAGHMCSVKGGAWVEAINYLGDLLDVGRVERIGEDVLRLFDEDGDVMMELESVPR